MGQPVSCNTAIKKYVNHSVSLGVVARKLAMKAPVSVGGLITKLNAMPQSRTLKQDWTTSDGSNMGGTVALTLKSDGTYSVNFDSINHTSLPDSIDFQVRAYLAAPGLPHALLFGHGGSVGGDLLKGQGEETHQESGTNPLISIYWNEIVSSAVFTVQHDQRLGGVLGWLVNDLINLGSAAAGFAIGAIIGVTREAIGWLGTTLGPGGTIGVIAGVAVFAVGALAGLPLGSAVILGTVAGVASGAVANALIKTRAMTHDEISAAQTVFGSEVPYGNILFTNLAGQNGRAFTAPGVDGKTYCNLGSVFDNTLGPGNNAYPYKGEVMIHELTHAWQIAHNSFVPGLLCSAIVNQSAYNQGDNVYAYGPAGPDWSAFNLEQQGAIVNQWYAGNNDGGTPQGQFVAMDKSANPYYKYIKGNILAGAAGFSTSWL